MKIYLDYAATTPVDKRVLKAMLPYFGEKFGNPMSLHQWGQTTREAIEKSRGTAAKFLGAEPEEIIFTSGSTESNNLAIKGIVNHCFSGRQKPHIITSAFEHHCVLESCERLKNEGLAEVTFIKPKSNGVIDPNDIKKAIKKNTVLVSMIYVNNEIGTIQPIAEIGKLIKKHTILFHVDATQASNYLDCNVKNLGVDLLSLSAHKIYGPKGAGILYIKKGTALERIQDGGEQEFGMRAGTHNVPAIVGLAKAVEIVSKEQKMETKRIKKLRNYLIEKINRKIKNVKLNGMIKNLAPHIANFSFGNTEGESIILDLSRKGIAVSTGSACSSGSLEPSHVLRAIGLTPEQAHGSLRISLGRFTTQRELDYFVDALNDTVKKLRKISGNILKDYYVFKKSN